MLVTDDEAKELKYWVIKKLEDISDADSDVLADYVLALIRADTQEPELRVSAIENLEDFLREHTAAFVDQIFLALKTKSYIPGYAPPPTAPLPSTSYQASGPVYAYEPLATQSRKRSFGEAQDTTQGNDPHYGQADRQMKQVRRGGQNGVARVGYQRPGARNYAPQATSASAGPASMSFPNMPITTPGLAFDPNDALGAMMAMQAMGFPLPGLPSQPTAGSSPSLRQVHGAAPPGGKNKVNARCRDYDTKGFCTRGNICPFDHGNDQIVVPPQEEYDPHNSVMLDTRPQQTGSTNGHGGSDRGRGRGRGRGDRGGAPSQRRNRAEFSQAGPNHDLSVTTVVVEQIPEENFEEQQVRDFFSAFGSITEVTMQAYKRLALVKFDDYYSAKAAYESPKVIFDNRFVKVYWYNANTAANGTAVKGSPASGAKAEEGAFDRAKFERDSAAAQKKLEERKALQAKLADLERQKAELARKQAEEKRRLEERLRAKGLPFEEDKKKEQEGEQEAGEEEEGADRRAEDESARKGKEGKEGKEASARTMALRATLAKLEAEAKSLGIDPDNLEGEGRGGRGRGRGRGYRGRGAYRGGARAGGAFNLDNRPKAVTVRLAEGRWDEGKEEGLRTHLFSVGDFVSIERSDTEESQRVAFKDRATAEEFFYGSRDIGGVGRVDFSWAQTQTPAGPKEDGDTKMGGVEAAKADGEEGGGAGARTAGGKGEDEVDYDVAEEDERWM